MTSFLDGDTLRTHTFIRHVELHDMLDSTNSCAAELARDTSIELPALIVARHQTAGRGRGQNKWWAADGALTFSVLLDPGALGIGTAKWPQLALATGVALCDALQQAAPAAACGIKWPNDVMIDGAKVCGVLVESPGGSVPAKDRLIIGIGINVNNSWRDAPHEVGPNGTALCDVTGSQHDLQTVLERTLQALEVRFGQLASGDAQLPEAWQSLCWLTEQGVEVQVGDRWIMGICLGVDSDGVLLVEDVNGVHQVRSGSVKVL
jgi:BirA family biotin operon repressor/biotin-[acetyl-CoA-carboxylase] ligase